VGHYREAPVLGLSEWPVKHFFARTEPMRIATATSRIGLRMEPEERTATEQAAAACGLTLSEFVRAAVSAAVALDDPPPAFSSWTPSSGVR